MDFITRNCPKFSKNRPPIAYAVQFDNYYKDDLRSLRRGWKPRFFDEAFLMRFEDFYASQPKRTPLGVASDDLRDRLERLPA
jgi:hypothetical protein